MKTALLILCTCGLLISCNQPGPLSREELSSLLAPVGARIDKPFSLQVSGADCYSGSGKNAGDVAFGFPNRGPDAALKFTLGPLRDGLSPGQEKQ